MNIPSLVGVYTYARRALVSALGPVLFLSHVSAAEFGTVQFLSSHTNVYEKQGAVLVGVTGNGGTVGAGATIVANTPAGSPPTTAIRTNDYGATASFPWGPTGNWYGYASLGSLDNQTRYFDIAIVDNASRNSEKTIGLVFWQTDRLVVNIPTCTVHILDDDFLVRTDSLQVAASESGEVRGKFLISHDGPTTYDVDVNFTRSGSATFNTDYTLNVPNAGAVTTQVRIPAGTNAVELRVFPVDDSAAESAETVILTLAAGNYAIDTAHSLGTATITDNDPSVTIAATDANSSESGDTGQFRVSRTADASFPLSVKYLITGTASNGLDYTYLSNMVVIPAGESFATITVAPLFDYLTEGTETVTLTLVTNGYKLGSVTNATVSITDFDDGSRKPPVLGGALAATARYGRFIRGSGDNANYHSFVIPIDFQQGVPLDNSGGNAATLFPNNPWTTNFNHYNATNPGSPIPFSNPIAGFGSKVGGSPLYFGQRYTFGIYAGDPRPYYAGSTNTYTNALRIQVYERNTMALVGTSNVIIPNISTTNEWAAFLSNGYTKTVTAFGLTTTLAFNNRGVTWNVLNATSNYFNVAYHITQSAAPTATQYVYMVELAGGTVQGWQVKAPDGSRAWSRLYTAEFEERPAWRTALLQTPQFFGEPLPPGYIGRSSEELMMINPPVTNVVNLTPSSYTNLGASPELRRSPVLDQLVTDLGNDPLLLANFVLNEIELTDAIDYNDNLVFSETSVNLGGVNRSALGTLLEGQGSPTEQCGLLVYLLRKAGYPATYVFPPHNGLQLVDARLSKLLRTQIRYAVDNQGYAWTTNQLIPVNYPWVAAYIGTNWVHIFPWLKDTEVQEGFNLYDYMPAQYDNAFKWARSYAMGDTNLLALSPEDDSPLIIYPRFLQKTLGENAPGVSMDELGIRAWNRRHYYARWSDLPTPTSVTNANTVFVESLGSSSITNVSPSLTNIFNTVSVEISSVNSPTKKVASGELRVAEILNRRFIAWHTNLSGGQHRLSLSLGAFRTNITATKAFVAASLLNAADTNAIVNLTTNVTLDATNDQLKLTIVHKRHRSLPGNFSEPQYWSPYLGFSVDLAVTNTRYMNKGDLAAICINAGRVTRKMLEQHTQEIWNQERAGVAQASDDRYQGEIAFLMGMSFYEKADKFTELATRLHKAQPIANFASGMAMLRAKRDATGQLPAGKIIYVQPVVDMFYKEVAAIGNQTAHLDSSDDGYGPSDRVFELAITAHSALEHGILNRFYQQSDSVSTVRLLQMAQTSNAVVRLTRYSYVTEGDKIYPPGGSTQLKNADASMWSTITGAFASAYVSNNVQVFITPGAITSPSRSFTGVGALIYRPGIYYALIGDGLNGGYAPTLPEPVLDSASLADTSVVLEKDNTVVLDSVPPIITANSESYAPSEAVSLPDVSGYLTDSALVNGTIFSDTQDAANDLAHDQLQITGTGTRTNVWEQYDTGVFATTVNTPGGWVSDPVNAVTGEFYIDAVDLELHGPMPLQVRRNYSSHNVFDGDFGCGWKLNYAPFLSVSVDAQSRLLYAAEADGTVIAYRRQTNAGVQQNTWAPLPKDNPRLQNLSGSVGNLFNGAITMTTNSGVLTYTLRAPNGDVRTYKTNSFALSTKVKRNRPYLDKWQDNRGNFFKFIYGTNSSLTDFGKVCRVESGNGNFLGFTYDIYGHLIEAFTGDGRRLAYEYDDFGDLVKVRLPDASEMSYDYLHDVFTDTAVRKIYSTHLIVRERKPEGRLLQNEYDRERRVVNQYATVGTDLRPVRNASFSYSNSFTFRSSHTNFVTGHTLVTDYLTNVTRYEFTNSLITRILDPLNRETRQTWWLDTETNAPAYPRSLKRIVDRRGLTNDFKYDGKGNLTNGTITGDLTGAGVLTETATTVFTYNTNALPTRVVDAVGNQTVYTYTNALSPFLRTSEERYASNSTLITATVFEYYHVTNAAPSGNYLGSYGLLQRITRASGSGDAASAQMGHDPRGFLIQELRFAGTGDPAVSNAFFYNLRGQRVEMADAAGRVTRQSHDARGNVEWREVLDEQGNVLSREAFYYNQNGELTWTDGPRSGPEDFTWRDYDGAGRKTQEVRFRTRARADGTGVEPETGDDRFATSFYEYDSFNNLVKVIDPRGHYARMFYDAMGQLRSRRFYDGSALSTNAAPVSTEGFAYEPGGQISFATNALGGVTEKQYTSTGQLKFQKNPTGATNAWRYYLDGRPQREVQGNGAFWETTCDDANRRVTRTFRAASGIALATNSAELDRRGNVVRTVNAAGSSFTNIFDGLDRLRSATGPILVSAAPTNAPMPGGPPPPVQQAVTNYYDAAGRAFTNVNALGEKTIALFDALGRVTRLEVRNATNVLVRESDTTYFADFHSHTTIEGLSSASPIATRRFTDTMGNEVLTYRYPTYPTVATVEYTSQAYDAAGNRTQRRESSAQNGVTTLWATNGWTYDGRNRVRTQSDRDGAQTTFSYDAAGNATNRVMPGGLVWRAQCNSAGQLLEDFNLGAGGSGARTNTYTYFNSASPFAGLPQTRSDGRGMTCAYGYDEWLRQTTNSHSGPLPEQNLTTILSFDVRGLLTNVTESFASTNTGPSTTIKRSYDGYGLLKSESITVGSILLSSAQQSWDSAGRRNALGLPGFGFSYGWRADGLLASSAGVTGGGTYSHDTAGLPASRVVGARTTTVTSRDGVGRPLGVSTTIAGSPRLTETLAWTGDGLLSTHTLAREDFTDSRQYAYADVTRRLIEERLNLDGYKRWTNSFGYDGGSGAGPGVLTALAGTSTGGPASWSGGADALSRVSTETNTAVLRTAKGRVNGLSTVSALLDGKPVSVSVVGTQALAWQATLELTPGTHEFRASARHPSGQFTATTTNWFTNNASSEVVFDTHDAAGHVTQRVWKTGSTTNRTQTLTWDGRNRLTKVIERDGGTNGRDWTAVYDALGRRVQSTEFIVSNSVAIPNPIVVTHYFDPLAEFLELGVSENGRTTWKLIGPDLDGSYGGLNGVGGFDAIIPGPELYCPTLADARGNVHAVYDQTHGALMWNPSRTTGYGAVPANRPPALGSPANLVAKAAWRNRASDAIGYVWLGANWYDPAAGRFLSFDPLGHDSSPSGYSFAHGDPINYFDADGRMGNPTSSDLPPDAGTVLRTFLGDIERTSTGWGIWSGGMYFSAPDAWPGNDFGSVAPGTGLGFSSGGNPMREIFGDLNRARDIVSGVGYTVGGFIPWVGDAMDVHDVVAPGSSALDRTLSGASLTANAWTAGLLPNLGPIRRGLQLIRGAGDIPHHAPTFQVAPHGEMPSPRPTGMQSHHGVNSVWVDANYAGYIPGDAPAVLMPNVPNHNATRGEFNRWRGEIAVRQGVDPGNVDWGKVSSGEAWSLAEKQFDAARVPESVRNDYFRQFNAYLDTLKKR